MSLDNVTPRAATLDDLTGIAAIYNQLWCNTLRNRGDVEAADFCARFNIAMQLQRSPIALVAEAEGRIIAACCIGIFEDGKPRTNPTWESCYNEMLAQATEMAKAADAKLEGSLFGDSREKATADRFAATGNEYAQGQLNLIIIMTKTVTMEVRIPTMKIMTMMERSMTITTVKNMIMVLQLTVLLVKMSKGL